MRRVAIGVLLGLGGILIAVTLSLTAFALAGAFGIPVIAGC